MEIVRTVGITASQPETERLVLGALLEFTGIEPERFLAKWVSASEGRLFVETVQGFTETLRSLPPLQEALNNTEGRPSKEIRG